jgi:hypothetical protein
MTQSEIFAPFHEVHYLLVRLWKTLFAYQFVVRVTPHEFIEDDSHQEQMGSGKLTGHSGGDEGSAGSAFPAGVLLA